MAVAIPNFEYSYRRKGKPVFVPTAIGRRIGNEVKGKVEDAYDFDPIYFHLRRGGHVAAMHHHRDNLLFARIDISRFFYSVSRRRVQSALDRIGVANARFYAKWSTVANPYGDPKYALPYGFVQSPILASLVIATSQLGDHLRGLSAAVSASVYMDDIYRFHPTIKANWRRLTLQRLQCWKPMGSKSVPRSSGCLLRLSTYSTATSRTGGLLFAMRESQRFSPTARIRFQRKRS